MGNCEVSGQSPGNGYSALERRPLMVALIVSPANLITISSSYEVLAEIEINYKSYSAPRPDVTGIWSFHSYVGAAYDDAW